MIAVDTSVWIEYLRQRGTPLALHLDLLLDHDEVVLPAPTWLELLGGADTAQRRLLRRTLMALSIFYPSRDTWNLVETWVERTTAHGQRFGVADLLIAGIAAERGAKVWSLDDDFARLGHLGLVKLHRIASSRRR